MRPDDRARADADRPAAGIEHRERIDACPRLEGHALGLEHGRERVALARDHAGAPAEILRDRSCVPLDEMPRPFDPARLDLGGWKGEAEQVALEFGAGPQAQRDGLEVETS